MLPQHASQAGAEKLIAYDIYLPTIQIIPVHWKEQAFGMFVDLKGNYYKMTEALHILTVTHNKQIETLNRVVIIAQATEKLYNYTVACQSELTLFKALHWTTAVVVTSGSIIAICVRICIERVRNKTAVEIRKQIIATVENLRSNEISRPRQCQYDVFLSYSSRDREWVEEELLHKLEQSGYTVCYDQRRFPNGKANRCFYRKRHTDKPEDGGCILTGLSVQRLGSV